MAHYTEELLKGIESKNALTVLVSLKRMKLDAEILASSVGIAGLTGLVSSRTVSLAKLLKEELMKDIEKLEKKE